MQTHFCQIERSNESFHEVYYGTAICGRKEFEYGDNDIKYVTCKKCIQAYYAPGRRVLSRLMRNWNKSHEEGGNCQTITS